MEINHWNIIYTKPKAEIQVTEYLKRKGITVYLPLNCTIVQWSDRKKKILKPMFPNYVFVKFSTSTEKNVVFETCGVLRFLNTNNKLDMVKDEEINIIRKLLENSSVSAHKNLQTGDHVIVTCGYFKGMVGKLFQEKGSNRFIVHLEGLKQYLSVELSSENLERSDFISSSTFSLTK